MVAVKPWWRETIETVLWALVLALVLRALVIQAFWIPSGSMIPTLLPERCGAKFRYSFRANRGQITSSRIPGSEEGFVKRLMVSRGAVGDR
jgi:signal peptidase I